VRWDHGRSAALLRRGPSAACTSCGNSCESLVSKLSAAGVGMDLREGVDVRERDETSGLAPRQLSAICLTAAAVAASAG
jgi:hypothetical protein